MGNLPCPMPADYKHQHSHLIFAIKHGKDKSWIESETEKLRKWSQVKGVLRLSWDRSLMKWLEKAILIETEQAAGRRAYGVQVVGANNHSSGGSLGRTGGQPDSSDSSELARKIEAYQTWLRSNPRLAQEYLERQPARTQQAILRGMDG